MQTKKNQRRERAMTLSGCFLHSVASLTSVSHILTSLWFLQSGKFSGSSPAAPSQPQGLSYAEDAAEHENMKAVLKISSPALEDATPVLGVRTRSRASRGTFCWVCGGWYSHRGHPRKIFFFAVSGILCPRVHVKSHYIPRTLYADLTLHLLTEGCAG